MPAVRDKPDLLKPFAFHGVIFNGETGGQCVADCPFCSRDGKFYVNPSTGQWDCKVCMEKGNIHTFLKRLWEESKKLKCDYTELAKNRKLLYPESLADWGLCKSILIDNEWILPGYVIDPLTRKPRMKQLYAWREDYKEKRMRFICQGFQHTDDAFPTNHGLFIAKWDAKKHRVAVCEGLWDGVAFRDTISRTKEDNDTYSYIGSESASMYSHYNVIATPGANVFYESWCSALGEKDVTFFYDNDHPRKQKNDTVVQGSGILGVKRAVEVLTSGTDRPQSISYLKWGDEDYDSSLPTRYDVRDHLTQSEKPQDRSRYLGELFSKIVPIPDDWIPGKEKGTKKLAAAPKHCATWKDLQDDWKAAMFWNDGLDAALPAMITTVVTVPLKEDLVWLKVMSPASTGKTELAEALALADDAVTIVSTFTGLHSGVRSDDGSDYSLIAALGGRCLVIKEGDTLLRLPDRERIWAELRDAYDQNSRTHFKNGVSNQYLEHPFGHILCGTESLHDMDDSELGQRYLNITIMRKIDPKVESAINRHKLTGLFATLSKSPVANGQGNSTSEKLQAKQRTAGYINYLRSNIESLVMEVAANSPPEVIAECDAYAAFISHFRARPSSRQTEEATRELSTRLATQIGKMAIGLGVVTGQKCVNTDIMKRVRKIAIDTAHGVTLDIGRFLYDEGEQGLPTSTLAAAMLMGETEMREMLKFLRKIEVVTQFKLNEKVGLGTSSRWKLTSNARKLYKLVMEK